MMMDTIPRNYSFKEISSLTNVKPYVLRFWETEFDEIDPVVDQLGEKNYSDSDIKAIERVKKLLFEDKLSIPEAKLQFYDLADEVESNTEEVGVPTTSHSKMTPHHVLHEIKERLTEIKKLRGWN